jgi:predicted ATP-grasp superfamily ATP-dependent carboligase
VVELAVEMGTTRIIGLGAAPAGVPHTRPIPVTATASNQILAGEVGFRPGSRDRPARMIDVIGAAADDAGIDSIGLVVRVPHYVSTTPFPAASIALLEAVARVSGLTIDTASLKESAASTIKQVDELISRSEEHLEMVRQLEEQYPPIDHVGIEEHELPSGDEIAAELEEYLRGEGEL